MTFISKMHVAHFQKFSSLGFLLWRPYLLINFTFTFPCMKERFSCPLSVLCTVLLSSTAFQQIMMNIIKIILRIVLRIEKIQFTGTCTLWTHRNLYSMNTLWITRNLEQNKEQHSVERTSLRNSLKKGDGGD